MSRAHTATTVIITGVALMAVALYAMFNPDGSVMAALNLGAVVLGWGVWGIAVLLAMVLTLAIVIEARSSYSADVDVMNTILGFGAAITVFVVLMLTPFWAAFFCVFLFGVAYASMDGNKPRFGWDRTDMIEIAGICVLGVLAFWPLTQPVSAEPERSALHSDYPREITLDDMHAHLDARYAYLQENNSDQHRRDVTDWLRTGALTAPIVRIESMQGDVHWEITNTSIGPLASLSCYKEGERIRPSVMMGVSETDVALAGRVCALRQRGFF